MLIETNTEIQSVAKLKILKQYNKAESTTFTFDM